MTEHCLAQRNGGIQIVPIIHQRFCNGFPNRLESGKVDYLRNIVTGEDFIQFISVANVRVIECQRFSRDLLNSLK